MRDLLFRAGQAIVLLKYLIRSRLQFSLYLELFHEFHAEEKGRCAWVSLQVRMYKTCTVTVGFFL